MYAIGKGYVTCSEPRECCQPGTEIVTYDGVDLEFCVKHAVRRWDAQDAA